jgi:hypothetical protein
LLKIRVIITKSLMMHRRLKNTDRFIRMPAARHAP